MNQTFTPFALAAVAALQFLTTPLSAQAEQAERSEQRSIYRAPTATTLPVIDGIADDASWAKAPWRDISQRWLGPDYTAEDFQGRYKVVWAGTKIYLLVELVDDVLIDTYRDPLVQYWDDDCLEVFIDEDASGGDHQYNHNAFAYHVSLDNRAIDIGTDKQARDYSQHVSSQWRQTPDTIVWELAIDIYTDAYQDEALENQLAELQPGKIMGLMVAYCDNDGSDLRENFIGSEFIAGNKKDRGWIDASLFGSLVLDK